MVAIKYAPMAAACFALCMGVGASVLSKRRVEVPAITTPNVGGGKPSAFGGRAAAAAGHKAADDPPPANTFGISGTVPGTLVVSNGGTTLTTLQTPGGDAVSSLPSADLSIVGALSGGLATLITVLTALAHLANLPVPLPLPVAAVPGVPLGAGAPSTDPTALVAQITQEAAALQALLPGLGALPAGLPVPANVTDAATAVIDTVSALPPSVLALVGGGVPSNPLDTIGNVVAFVTALIPLLTSLAANLP